MEGFCWTSRFEVRGGFRIMRRLRRARRRDRLSRRRVIIRLGVVDVGIRGGVSCRGCRIMAEGSLEFIMSLGRCPY